MAIVNGIDTQVLKEKMAAMKKEPALAEVRSRAHNKWAGGAYCRTTIKDFYAAGEDMSHKEPFELAADEPPVLLGEDHGPTATEALLYALSSCVLTTLVYHASARNVKLNSLEIIADGKLDLRGFLGLSDEVRNGYSSITLTFKIDADASDEEIRKLVELGQKRSPVFDMVTHTTPVNAKIEKAAAVGQEV